MSKKNMSFFQDYEKTRKSLMTTIKIDHEQVLYITVGDLIEKRNSDTNKQRDAFDVVLRYYLTEDEFQKHVINKEPLI